jgi:uncharacterized protein
VAVAVAGVVVVATPGLTLTCRGSSASPLVITAHKMRAFLLASATTAFCQPARSRSAAAHWEIGLTLLTSGWYALWGAVHAERGLDFEDAKLVFQGVTIEVEDMRKDYGERRIICFGLLASRLVVVGYTPRGSVRHVFSMRKANDREQTRLAPYFGL